MATMNLFNLLVDDDNDDPNQLIAKLPVIVAAAAPATKKSAGGGGVGAKSVAKLPSKPYPLLRLCKRPRMIGGRFGGRRVRGGRGGRGFNRDSADNENFYGNNNGINGSPREH